MTTIGEITDVRTTKDDQYPASSYVGGAGRTSSGVYIDADNMLQIATCWACTRFLSQTAAMLPWDLKRRTDRGYEVQTYHPIHYLISSRPNPEWSSFQFRETLMHWALRYGNGYAEIERSEGGRPVAIWPLHPRRVRVMRRDDNGQLIYEIDGGKAYIPFEDMFHLRGMGEGPVGLSVVAYAAQSFGWARAAQIFGSSFFRQGGNPSGVVSMKRSLSPEAMTQMRQDFRKLYGGASGSNGVMFLDMEMEYTPISVPPDKGQFIQTNEYLIGEICRWFGVPPHKVYDLSHATFSNIEHQSIEVVMDSIAPWSKRFEDEADYKLLGQNRRSLSSRIDLRELLRADTATRMNYLQGLRNIGAINVNEIRESEGLNGIGPDGEKYTMQSGMTTLDKIGADPAPSPASDPAPSPAPVEPTPRSNDANVEVEIIKRRFSDFCREFA
jgi:HK97 family phage portal protein